MKLDKNHKIGIWGYGIVGKSITNYLYTNGYTVSVMDKRTLTKNELNELEKQKINFYTEADKKQFFNLHDYIFFSPGINVSFDYATHREKWLSELDVFSHIFGKNIIAITGSIGKTSVTHMLSTLFKLAHKHIVTGGNIGTATFDLLPYKNTVDYAVLEVSSFQLQNCTMFAPNLAIWTNFYPNHLDHHGSIENYFKSKYNIIAQQKNTDSALINLMLREPIQTINQNQKLYSYFTAELPKKSLLSQLQPNEKLYYSDNTTIFCYVNGNSRPLLLLNEKLCTISFLENIVLLSAVCDILNIEQKTMYRLAELVILPEHRLEKVTTEKKLHFYNDSKSTTTASTLAAIKKLFSLKKPIHLFLGGMSKGVNREPFIKEIKPFVHYVYCFGKEADELHSFCKKNSIPSESCISLEVAFNHCITQCQPDDIVLFSPAGSSYDLYTDYQERGKQFKNLVKTYSHL